jgi:hypothetical protein
LDANGTIGIIIGSERLMRHFLLYHNYLISRRNIKLKFNIISPPDTFLDNRMFKPANWNVSVKDIKKFKILKIFKKI